MENSALDIAGMTVLLVDDTPANIDLLRKILAEQGFIISMAPSCELALKLAPRIIPDLILLDIMMPGINGYETCEKLKSDPITKDIPIIFLSAKTDPSDIVKGFKVGGSDYITKPIYREEVLIRVKTQLQLRIKTKRLEETQKRLEKSNQDLLAFASIVSHDLKAPLRNIINLGEFLKEDYESLLDEKGQGYINKMEIQSTRMSQMIEGILEFSQVIKNTKPFESIDLHELIQKVMDNLQASIVEAEGKINIGDLPTIQGDSLLLLQLFQNLISNSLKFKRKDEAPVINIHGNSNVQGFNEIWVEDNGIGFDEKRANNIFLPLNRMVSKDEYEGSGIGLATCKKIVDHHKGTITFRSQPGKGTTFIVSIPMA